MASFYEANSLIWQQSQGLAVGMVIFSMILVLNGCAYHKESEHSGDYGHGSTSYQHAGVEYDGHHQFSGSLREELMLTDQQKQAFDRIETDYKKMIINKTADIRAAEIDLAALLGKEEHDRQAVQQQVNAIGEIKKDMMMARIDSLLTLKALLTKGQYEKFREILHQRMAPMMANSPHVGL